MPYRPRLLYPLPSNSSECLTSCSPDCLLYNLCTLPHPAALPLPPHIPPPPPPPSTPIHLHHFPRLLLSLLIPSALLVLLSLLFLFLCLFFVYRRSRSVLNPTPVPLPFHLNPPDVDITQDSDHHYVWYIRTVGLDDSAIRAISASSYTSRDGAYMAACTVCLAEFHEGDLLRLLPKCGHAFHVSCIDTWLRAHANCPLCRAAVVVPPTCAVPMLPASPSDIDGQSSDSGMLNSGDGSARGNAESSLCTLPVRRSASMGSLASKGGNFEEGSASNSKELKTCFGLEVELVRSWSCGGNRFFLSRHGQG